MYKAIMAPTDGSETEKPAILVAVRLAQCLKADLHLVRVLAPPLVADTPNAPVLEITEQAIRDLRRARHNDLKRLGEEVRSLADIRVTTELKIGQVTQMLRDYAEEAKVDLMVMSSHSRGGISRATMGSVTDYLIRNTHIPVLVVKPPAIFFDVDGKPTVTRIVVPVDGSAIAEQIFPEVAAIAAPLKANVNLFHVLTPTTYSQREIMQPGLPWWDADTESANAYLATAADYFASRGIPVNKEVALSEDVASAILDYCTRIQAGLLAVATRGRGGLRRLVFGTVADELARKSRISLLVFHPKNEGSEGTRQSVT